MPKNISHKMKASDRVLAVGRFLALVARGAERGSRRREVVHKAGQGGLPCIGGMNHPPLEIYMGIHSAPFKPQRHPLTKTLPEREVQGEKPYAAITCGDRP